MKSFILRLGLFGFACSFSAVETRAVDPAAVLKLTTKVADWQIETFEDSGKYRALNGKDKARLEARGRRFPRKYDDRTWHMGALYAGMNQFRRVAEHPEKYTEWLKMIGERNDWKLYDYNSPYHADDHAVGQFYLSLYREFNDPAMLKPTKNRFDWILENPKTG